MVKRRDRDPGLGERIAGAIERAGLSDTEAAAEMGISAALLGRIKRGERGTVHFKAGLRLARRLKIDPWELAFGRDRASTPSLGVASALVVREGTEPPRQDEERLAQIESELREMQELVKAIEPKLRQLLADQAPRKRGAKSA